MKRLSILLGAAGLVLMHPLAAQAARLSISGCVELMTSESPVSNARVTVTFHGHELGIHEYTTERTVRARTDEEGNFLVAVKVPDRRYNWTHATVEISETDVSKSMKVNSACLADGTGGCRFSKDFRVNPLD